MWKLYTIVILSACAATAMSQSECSVVDINDCTTSLTDSIGNGTETTDTICRAAHTFVMCLNRLTACINNPAFTQARQMMESRDLDHTCPEAIQYPYVNSVGTPAIMTVYLLVTLLMLGIFT
ncbi:uncharacterized protein LOC124276415 isoform X2 [Haliotis rubra]|uniref:uncharacterized protein LOC124276415 isoform X1 n=1 Tax=Haliotis rubra TaxID=36100 RepID=UPI001EE52F3C|nr:uncharacterized protein LOC124276415 isoform X1 [Haliotis rubra]XP_046568013.1 uncharacterized protein LOC124276415 isoform X2 [Haliotis rubra]